MVRYPLQHSYYKMHWGWNADIYIGCTFSFFEEKLNFYNLGKRYMGGVCVCVYQAQWERNRAETSTRVGNQHKLSRPSCLNCCLFWRLFLDDSSRLGFHSAMSILTSISSNCVTKFSVCLPVWHQCYLKIQCVEHSKNSINIWLTECLVTTSCDDLTHNFLV